MEKHYSVVDVANAYDLHPETVREFCRDGKIEYTRIGHCYRFTEDQLRKYEAKRGPAAVRVRALQRVVKRLAKSR